MVFMDYVVEGGRDKVRDWKGGSVKEPLSDCMISIFTGRSQDLSNKRCEYGPNSHWLTLHDNHKSPYLSWGFGLCIHMSETYYQVFTFEKQGCEEKKKWDAALVR
jgi:hypothetical protein